MASWHQTIVIGNVGKDAVLRHTQSNIAVAGFSVAATEQWKDSKTNEKMEKTTWYNVSCWRGLADVVAERVKKGMQVFVVGTIEARAYKTSAGEPAASLELTAQRVIFLGKREDGSVYQEDMTPPNDEDAPNNMSDIPF